MAHVFGPPRIRAPVEPRNRPRPVPFPTVAWPPRPPAHLRRKLPGFIEPCAPTLVRVAPAGPEWSHEIKHDGWRMVARKEHDSLRLWTRNGNEMTAAFAQIAAGVAALPAETCTLDGEAANLLPDGHSNFLSLRTRAGARRARLIALDIMELDGQDLRPELAPAGRCLSSY